MDARRILITGGAGFVGSSLAIRFAQYYPNLVITALDNLKRRGSELNLTRLRAHGIQFLQGDVRCPEDLAALEPCDLLIDCAAEPSVQAGTNGSPQYVLNNNLVGTLHCLEAARRWNSAVLLLSTSRVYPIRALNDLPFEEAPTRYRWLDPPLATPGFSPAGIAESFALDGARSFYGTSKLCSEFLLQEYAATGLRTLINRCGILAGPWQMGKVDQGVITHWIASHHYERPLRYLGFGGQGKQVRDVLHVDDLFDLIVRQLNHDEAWNGSVFTVGGGAEVSTSLRELTTLCQALTEKNVPIESVPETSAVDLRIYLSDSRRASATFGWQPQRSLQNVVTDIHHWIVTHDADLKTIFS
ncbi:MAG: NAD-dependent epimerase/dehydratase family protein [Planctomycetota bacterium]